MKFLIDTQLPPKLATYLRSKGFHSIHTTYFENGHLLDDKRIIEIAIQENRIIVTKDSDFLDNYLLKGSPPKVLLLEFGNLTNKKLISYFENHLQLVIQTFEEESNLVVFRQDEIIGY